MRIEFICICVLFYNYVFEMLVHVIVIWEVKKLIFCGPSKKASFLIESLVQIRHLLVKSDPTRFWQFYFYLLFNSCFQNRWFRRVFFITFENQERLRSHTSRPIALAIRVLVDFKREYRRERILKPSVAVTENDHQKPKEL